MRHTILLASFVLISSPSCGKTDSKNKTENTTNTTNTARDSNDGKDTAAMTTTTTTDTSPEGWKQAEAIAAKAAVGQLDKRSDALPFMFMADSPAAVLVHNGAVVTSKGAAAAGSYLRDLGIVDGQGPKIADVLFVLFAFEAWPPVEGVPEEHFINSPDNQSLEELTARIDMETDAAHIVLHYWLPEPEMSAEDQENDVGSVDPEAVVSAVRPLLRTTLVIPKTGDAAWKPIEKLNWAL